MDFNQFRTITREDGTQAKVLNFQSNDNNGESVELTLNEILNEDGIIEYQITCTIVQGQSVNGFLEYTTKEGTTSNNSYTEISISYDGEPNANDKVIINPVGKENITIYNQSSTNWSDITKNSTMKEVSLTQNEDEDYSLNKDITYTISATHDTDNIIGMVYTKDIIVTDTLTLPEGLSFIQGSSSVRQNDNKVEIVINDTSILDISCKNSSLSAEDFTCIINGNVLTLTYQNTAYNIPFKVLPVKVNKISVNLNMIPNPPFLLYQDLSYSSGDINGNVNRTYITNYSDGTSTSSVQQPYIFENNTFYYMIDIYNPNITRYTYNLQDICGTGYMGDTYFEWTKSTIDFGSYNTLPLFFQSLDGKSYTGNPYNANTSNSAYDNQYGNI